LQEFRVNNRLSKQTVGKQKIDQYDTKTNNPHH
jgi:hypothetical protein